MRFRDYTLELRDHWGIRALSEANTDTKPIHEIVENRLFSVGDSLPETEYTAETKMLEKYLLVYEIVAFDSLKDYLECESTLDHRNKCVAASSNAFEIRTLLPIPTKPDCRQVSITTTSFYGYGGGRCPELDEWLDAEYNLADFGPEEQWTWDEFLRRSLLDCWAKMFRASCSESDLRGICDFIKSLPERQKVHEKRYLESSELHEITAAARLVGLYNFARATEITAEVRLHQDSSKAPDNKSKFFKHAEYAYPSIHFALLMSLLGVAGDLMMTLEENFS